MDISTDGPTKWENVTQTGTHKDNNSATKSSGCLAVWRPQPNEVTIRLFALRAAPSLGKRFHVSERRRCACVETLSGAKVDRDRQGETNRRLTDRQRLTRCASLLDRVRGYCHCAVPEPSARRNSASDARSAGCRRRDHAGLSTARPAPSRCMHAGGPMHAWCWEAGFVMLRRALVFVGIRPWWRAVAGVVGIDVG